MMGPVQLVQRGLLYYWRTNVAVVLGVATAVAVLAGALLVGDSVRGSLRDLVLQRLGRTDHAIVSSEFFREALADDLRADEGFASSFTSIAPLISMQGAVSEQGSGRRASRVLVYGVDDRFWRFHGLSGAPAPVAADGRDALVSRALAAEIGATVDGSVLVRLERPSAIPIESLHGRKDEVGRTLRLTVRGILGAESLGEFALQPQQGEVRAVFVPLGRLQRELDLAGRVNTLLVSEIPAADLTRSALRTDTPGLEEIVRRRAALEDLELTVRPIESRGALAVESAAGIIDEVRATAIGQAAAAAGMTAQPVFTYLANTLRSRGRELPYSLVTAIDLREITNAGSGGPTGSALRTDTPAPTVGEGRSGPPPIVVNDWTARDLRATVGDPLTLEYFVWEEPGRLAKRTADFRIAAVVPIAGAAADRDLAPVYPGLSDADTIGDWDPPFPVDLRRIRPLDEDYWKAYRTTPKAFIPLEVGQALWRSRYGDRTSVRIAAASGQSLGEARDQYAATLRAAVDPLAMGLIVSDVRESGLAASRGATDFGEYFTYFSFFLVVSALMLAALFFRLGVEQRAREVGLLRSVGYTTPRVRRLFMAEALALVALGSLVGVAGAVGYAWAMMAGLRTWWAGAVGTTLLTLHVSPASLAAGVAGAFVAALVCVWWTLRGLSRLSERSLLAGNLTGEGVASGFSRTADSRPFKGTLLPGALGFGLLGTSMIVATAAGLVDRTAAFFGAGTSLLVACLCLVAFGLKRPARRPIEGAGWWPMGRLGLRNAAVRPGRSVLAIGVIASASFILISVGAFRRESPSATDPRSGVGGYALLVETLLPLVNDPNSAQGRESLGLTDLTGLDAVSIEPFRLQPGDDASCLNLYEPKRPRILGASGRFMASGRFAFQDSLASTEAERGNPWLLLERDLGTDVVPVVADANSMTYVLHKQLGEDFVMEVGGRLLRLRLVAALADSILQSELVMSEASFLKLFPDQQGYRFLLVEAPPAVTSQVAEALERGTGADIGADAVSTTDRLAEFHRVENTYLSTFQILGGLGLLVGTLGLAAVLMRNVLERRRELALLGAVGYRRGHVASIVLAENVVLLVLGLAVGSLCAAIAIAPTLVERGGALAAMAGSGGLLVAVLAAGLLSSVIATRAALGTPLLESLRTE